MSKLNFFLIFLSCFCDYCNAQVLLVHSIVEEPGNSTFDFEVASRRIINGRPAQLGDVPYQISLKQPANIPRSYHSYCGGSLIKPNKIITAAHCVVKTRTGTAKLCQGKAELLNLGKFYAVAESLLNMDTLNRKGQWRQIRNWTYPSDYNFPSQDIAILFTTAPFTLNENVKLINPASVHKDYQGKCMVAGFGRIDRDKQSPILRVGEVLLLPVSQCSRYFTTNMRKAVCISGAIGLTDVGEGDSGGPLVCTNTGDPKEIRGLGVLVGVMSGKKYSPPPATMMTRVSYYYPYIMKNEASLRQLLGCQDIILFCYFALFVS